MATKPVKKMKPTPLAFVPPKKGPGGRPEKVIDADSVYQLGLIHCTAEEAASVLQCDRATIYNRPELIDALKRGWDDGQKSLKRWMHDKAEKGDTTMMIWLSKQRLGYKDKKEEEQHQVVFNVTVNEVPK
jgi:hypothetical protein